MAVNSGGQIKVLGLNGIVGQMTRHCCLSAHGHTLLPQKNITAPLPSLSPSSLPPLLLLHSSAHHFPLRQQHFVFSNPTRKDIASMQKNCEPIC